MFKLLNNPIMASLDYLKLLELDPRHLELPVLRQYIYSQSVMFKNKASAAFLKKQYPAAVHFLNQAIELNKGDWKNILMRGIIMSETGDYDSALEDLLNVRANSLRESAAEKQINQYLAHVFNRLGMMQFELKAYPEVIKKLDQAVYFSPNDTIILKNRAETYFLLGEYGPAMHDLTAVLSMAPQDADAKFRLSVIYNIIGKDCIAHAEYAKAVDYYTKAIALEPLNLDLLYERARSNFFQQVLFS